jgi:hypothetical protein
MQKNTYLRKLEIVKAKNTDTTTLAELKVQKKTKRELERFWEKAAIAWLEKNVWHKPYREWVAGW